VNWWSPEKYRWEILSAKRMKSCCSHDINNVV
jgi:hypothetical protein